MAHLQYSKFSDNVAPNAVITVGDIGTEDADYPLANLADRDPSLPGQFTTTIARAVFDFTTAQRLDVAALIHHNLDAGLTNVLIEGNATDAWGAPSFSMPFVIPAYRDDGFPVNPFLDLTLDAQYSATGFRFWSIAVKDVNSAAVKLGEVWLGTTKRTLTRNIQWGVEMPEQWRGIVHETDFGVKTAYPYGTVQRSLSGNIQTTGAGIAALQSLYQDSFGIAKAVLVIPDPTVNDALMVRLVSPWNPRQDFIDIYEQRFDVEALSCGLPL